MTPGVKKILLSQKTFANHLADEEAARQLAEQTPTAVLKTAATKAARKNARSSLLRTSTSAADMDVSMSEDVADDAEKATPPHTQGTQARQPTGRHTSRFAVRHPDDHLIDSRLPGLPSDAEMEALLAAPPLSYMEAQAFPSASSAPPRQFCEGCGYWGSREVYQVRSESVRA
ncbi:hypothetical protein MRB53_040462 [Persea americana]|nr:hypothetical protein MRB53_040462 [Persea americana]